MEQFGRRVNGRTIDVEGVLYWAPLDCPQRRGKGWFDVRTNSTAKLL